MARNLTDIAQTLSILTGRGGYDWCGNGSTVSDDTYSSICATFTTGGTDYITVSAVSTDTDVWDTITTEEIPIGVTIYGRWSSVTIGSSDYAMVYREWVGDTVADIDNYPAS